MNHVGMEYRINTFSGRVITCTFFVFGYEVGFNTTSKHIKVVPYKKITDNGSQNMEKILRHGFR